MKYNYFKFTTLSITWLWLILFALIPFTMMLCTSLLSQDLSHLVRLPITLANYKTLFTFSYLKIFFRSFFLAGLTTFFCLIIAFPFSYILAAQKAKYKNLLLLLLIVPFWTSAIIRTFAISALLQGQGLINQLLMTLHIIDKPLSLLYTNFAVLVGLVYNLLPFMILPIYTNIERLDHNLIMAAKDLGAKSVTIFRKIIIPLALPGIFAGCLVVMLPAMTLFYIPYLLGGARSLLLGNLIQSQFLFAQNWPQGAASSTSLTIFMCILLLIYHYKVSPNYASKEGGLL